MMKATHVSQGRQAAGRSAEHSSARRHGAAPSSTASLALGPAHLLLLQRDAGNRAVGQLVAQSTPAVVEHQATAADPRRKKFPWGGDIKVSWSAALRKVPRKDADDPHRTTIADLAPGTKVWVTGEEHGWLHVEVDVAGKFTRGYVSQELVHYVKGDEFVIDQDALDKALEDHQHISTEKAFVILKQAETAKAADATYQPDAKTKERIETATWVLSGSGRWVVDPQTYRVTLTAPKGERIRLRSIEDFILFVEAVERQYPSSTPQDVASEIRQMWFNSDAWRAMVDSRGITSGGKDVDIETRPNPIAEAFDMGDLAPSGGGRKVFETRMGSVDISHVMTGIDGALGRSPTSNSLMPKVLRTANAGDPRDFMTWSGDIGQAYAQYLVQRWVKGDTRTNLLQFVEAEADPAALLGDIHGYIATQVWRDMQGAGDPIGGPLKVSSILRTLYLLDKDADADKGAAGGGRTTYQAFVEKLTGREGATLRDFVVERSLKFGPFEYAKVVASEWGIAEQLWEGATSGGKSGVLDDQMAKFHEQHRRNEANAPDADRLGGLVDTFMNMLRSELR
jgi:hypothetical protein